MDQKEIKQRNFARKVPKYVVRKHEKIVENEMFGQVMRIYESLESKIKDMRWKWNFCIIF